MVRFNTDHMTSTGKKNSAAGEPCQDYALSGVLEDSAWAVVSDGCSGGARTDIGSRLICLATAQALPAHRFTSALEDLPAAVDLHQQMFLGSTQGMLGVTTQDQLATSLYTYLTAEKGGFLHIRGDGVLATVARDGTLTLHKLEWEGNMPFYPAYAPHQVEGFIKAQGGNLTAPEVTFTTATFAPGTAEPLLESGTLSLQEGITGFTWALPPEEVATLKAVAVFTDGVTQLGSTPWYRVAAELLAFKTTEGAFAKRRMNRMLKDAAAKGLAPFDDIGYAVIHIAQDEEE